MQKSVNQSKGETPPAVISEKKEGPSSQLMSEVMKHSSSPPVKRPRPANGFLGFCHRHRPIVSRRNKKLENRLVTKILGSWWTSLTPDQRKVYEDRAREYKAVFMAANPGYKWYTPRESTGNTPVTRQSNRRGRKLEIETATSGAAITPGKLADESQMGGLSSLMQYACDYQRKKTLDMVHYIASEHDYLETKPVIINNNTIMSVDSHCMFNEKVTSVDQIDEANHQDQLNEHNFYKKEDCEVETYIKQEFEIKQEIEDEEEDDGNGSSGREQEISSAQKRKLSKPKRNPHMDDASEHSIPECPSFKEFMKVCPTYPYDAFLAKKAEMSSAHKRTMLKRRKWAQALMEYSPDGACSPNLEENSPSRRRRKRRIGVTPRAQKRPRSAASPTPPSTSSVAQQGIPSAYVPHIVPRQQPAQVICRPCGPSIPLNFNHLDLLVSAAETLEHCCL